ncbi:putative multidrug ABC transporter permease YbhR [Flavobacterium bizetiae]|uniref:Putative multidrug ABC transporter permease YbhR n=1 Tax=Flavobacterium bizetiae TaxID=2704140 RepID=A0A6J4GHS2_9FLAO|nr:ABC transporter permease [Flavobacterium bizetiae]CAA9197602.1 putative multidrug ABC transporter permease YbhR [Flavobacterium bizetiae]CAD5341399.1 putative multidrug ABC transporter permease YbhR [Flavobacterium bizetiae]CAD5347697.1 putative multidrug ABC transporter permease YbhR [Flavobacterium bizetiae]
MQNFFSLLKREFRLFWSNKVLRLLFIGAPILYGVLLGYVYGKGKVTDLPIIIVDQDRSELSSKAIQMFEDNEVLSIASILYDQNNLSQIAIQKEATCVVIIPKDFEKMTLTKKYPEITTIVNTSNVLTANYASTAIQVCLGTLKVGVQIETLRKQGVPENLLTSQYEPFKTTFIKKYNRSTNYMYFLWPGVLATVLQQVLLLGLALSFASEFENGTFKDLVKRCPSILNLLAVKIIPYMIMSFGIWIIYWLFTLWFRLPFYENLLPLTFIAGIFVLSVSFIGILVSILVPSQLKATEILMVIATPSFILSGFTWPLSQMPQAVQAIANVIPLTHFLKAFRILIIENGTFSQTTRPVWNMIIIGIVCFIAAFISLHFKKKSALKQA